ncbi:MAG TPA: hypothetical protein PKK00_07160 [Bacteroidales bacterium]|nr:hypothetical protein [Bacteroidales bacterium]HPS17111.1 hypothetical protein [Bacteroidales bacterium]
MLTILSAYSQDSCKVLKPEIAGKYKGKCKKGLAQGSGTSEGIDKYTGNFKNGLPDGHGKYTWANGDIYDGSWKEGKKDGEGKFMYKVYGVDSTKYGLWNNDTFVKKIIPDPYKVFISRDLDSYSINKIGDGNKITLKIKKMGQDNVDIEKSDFSFIADNGLYREESNKYIYDQVIFPLHIKINYITTNKLRTVKINVVFEATINEPGDWEIILHN